MKTRKSVAAAASGSIFRQKAIAEGVGASVSPNPHPASTLTGACRNRKCAGPD
jgi:hypothetical protein